MGSVDGRSADERRGSQGAGLLVEVRELVEETLQDGLLALLRRHGTTATEETALLLHDRHGVEEAGVVDETTLELVEPVEELEVTVVTNTHELDEDRQLAHADEELLDLALRVGGLAIGEEHRKHRVGCRELHLQRVTVTAEVDRLELLDAAQDPAQCAHVTGATAPRVAVGSVDEPVALIELDVAQRVRTSVEVGERHLAIVVERRGSREGEVADVGHQAAGVGLVLAHLVRGAVVAGTDHRGGVAVGVETLVEADLLDEVDSLDEVRGNLVHVDTHCKTPCRDYPCGCVHAMCSFDTLKEIK